jgi:hypothetical protein
MFALAYAFVGDHRTEVSPSEWKNAYALPAPPRKPILWVRRVQFTWSKYGDRFTWTHEQVHTDTVLLRFAWAGILLKGRVSKMSSRSFVRTDYCRAAGRTRRGGVIALVGSRFFTCGCIGDDFENHEDMQTFFLAARGMRADLEVDDIAFVPISGEKFPDAVRLYIKEGELEEAVRMVMSMRKYGRHGRMFGVVWSTFGEDIARRMFSEMPRLSRMCDLRLLYQLGHCLVFDKFAPVVQCDCPNEPYLDDYITALRWIHGSRNSNFFEAMSLRSHYAQAMMNGGDEDAVKIVSIQGDVVVVMHPRCTNV